MNLDIVILAAGKGTRMKSKLPKVLHPLGGKPMLAHVIETASELKPQRIIVIYGHGGELVRQGIEECLDEKTVKELEWIEQKEQRGTGHAVQMASHLLDDKNKVLVLYGDVPLIQKTTLQRLINTNDFSALSLLTVKLADPSGYGRILRDIDNNIKGIVEHKDANEEQLNINEVNTGILCAQAKHLNKWVTQLRDNNAQGELYLTDIVSMAEEERQEIRSENPETGFEVEGINDRYQLASLERIYQQQLTKKLLLNGVTLIDPDRIDIRGEVDIDSDVTVDVNVIFEGKVKVESGCYIGPNCVLKNAVIGRDTCIEANSYIEDSKVEESCVIGPYARLRPGTVVKNRGKVGNFVEIKKSEIGEGSKVNHLSYVGDATLGKEVNVGAGTITCNYDGANKHPTYIGDGAFIGSNTSLIAPVKIGKEATTGAGSAINKDVEDKQLAIARGKQKNISGWQRPKKNKP